MRKMLRNLRHSRMSKQITFGQNLFLCNWQWCLTAYSHWRRRMPCILDLFSDGRSKIVMVNHLLCIARHSWQRSFCRWEPVSIHRIDGSTNVMSSVSAWSGYGIFEFNEAVCPVSLFLMWYGILYLFTIHHSRKRQKPRMMFSESMMTCISVDLWVKLDRAHVLESLFPSRSSVNKDPQRHSGLSYSCELP